MEIGRRVLIPASFNFSENYKEMRKVGAYPDVLLYAVVLACLENTPVESKSNSAIFKLLPDEVFQYPQVLSTSAEISTQLESSEFAVEFVAKCNEFFERNQISLVTDAALSNVEMLCIALRRQIDLQIGQGNPEVGGHSKLVVGIGVFKQTCFVLYNKVNKESFVILPCGHVQLRFRMMEIIGKAIGQNAIFPNDRIEAQLCSDCICEYSRDMFEFLKSFSRGISIITISSLFPRFTPSYLVCSLCSRRIPKEVLFLFCKCSNTVCFQCAVIERITSENPYCPACRRWMFDAVNFDASVAAMENLKRVLPSSMRRSKPTGRVNAAMKQCYSCSQEYALSHYLDIGDHLNCWVCVGCVESALRRGNCPHCKEVYNSDAVGIRRIMKEREKPIKPVNKSTSTKALEDASIPEEYKTVSFNSGQVKDYKQGSRPVKCAKCKAPTQTTDCHKCGFEKYFCVDCCITDVVTRFTSIDNRCSTCKMKFEPQLNIDMESQIYPCASCKKQISLLEAVHRCSDSSIYCDKCIGFATNSAPKNCSTCKKPHFDKHMMRRSQK